ncbi:translational GTPase TypA [Singulisphaera acidiphila]|uniref:Large ribosomal subunit assembly factor BipA n=1 Tax=Singulisphaera acidiphila (strain ATCC BAA-1392 / DSM 18658 / VKM B-2454 / MOB10) TaxID=886293 RepID=L0DLY3_SINAD|nr:translational GTPase TypA [Singulisphaera acidiphila]AGA29830.1 GTP-binding protein TypA/BipA [Singulisphaera acidiphila DSM 18658]
MIRRDDIRNVAIIAHVDHGKTTLVDSMLRQSGQFRASQLVGDCILDSNDQERERGITILAKNIAINYGDVKINIIDTPGHADFGGEVERTLQMADGALVLVDAFEGPMPQTKFVLRKAFANKIRPIVVINKIDRPDARPQEVLNEIFDTFVDLDADEQQLDFSYIYASGRGGFASHDPTTTSGDIRPLLDLIVQKVPGPEVDPDSPFRMLCTTLDFSEYVGRIAIGRIASGRVKRSQKAVLIKAENATTTGSIDSVLVFEKLGRVEVETAEAGDIVALVGLGSVDIGDTIASTERPEALPRIEVGEPTLSMLFTVNDSPLTGEGQFLTSRHLKDRLDRELRSNVALRVEPTAERDSFTVSGRGLLHLSVLIESMRREGYELAVGKPEVIMKRFNGVEHEPYEYFVVDVPHGQMGPVMELVGARRGELAKMDVRGAYAHLEFMIPARGLLGLRTRLMSGTQGEAIMHHNFHDYQPFRGEIPKRSNGVMISMVRGQAVAFALDSLQQRGTMFVKPGDDIYAGMIVAENARGDDMVVNPCKEKKLTNMRASGSDKNVLLKPPRELTLEIALEYIESDELVEITPTKIRLRKKELTEEGRKRSGRSGGKTVSV